MTKTSSNEKNIPKKQVLSMVKTAQKTQKTEKTVSTMKKPSLTKKVNKTTSTEPSKAGKSVRQTGKTALFITLAQPDKNGVSRWVSADEWTGEYAPLALGNGLSWGRKGSTLDSLYFIEKDRSQTHGNSIDAIRLNGYKE